MLLWISLQLGYFRRDVVSLTHDKIKPSEKRVSVAISGVKAGAFVEAMKVYGAQYLKAALIGHACTSDLSQS